MPWYRRLHWQILIGLIAGLLFGLLASRLGWGNFTTNWIKPWGTIFVNLLKMIAVPLILASLISGVASLSDLTKLSRIGGKTVGIYFGTTVIAVIIGLLAVNFIRPGKALPADLRKEFEEKWKAKQDQAEGTSEKPEAKAPEAQPQESEKAKAADSNTQQDQIEEVKKKAETVKESGPLKPIVDIVPENFIHAAGDNTNLLQVVFVALLTGIGLILIDPDKGQPVRAFFDGLNDVIIRIVDLVMYIAPVGVFALVASMITELSKDDPSRGPQLLKGLFWYAVTVVLGLGAHVALVYLPIVRFLTPLRVSRFLRGMRPALMLAFSTSSSGATLPVTKECVERDLGVSNEISSFTLPLGATINMDGTALYQAVAAVFIAQAHNMGLGIGDQVTIVVTAALASIGAAAVPGAGIITLVIILQAIHVPVDGIALILGIDRLLDMMRTVVNVTGDAVVTTLVAQSEGKLDLEMVGNKGD